MYRRGTDGAPEFVEVPAPTDEALQTVLHKVIMRMMKLLTRRGVLIWKGSKLCPDCAGRPAQGNGLRAIAVRRHQRFQPARCRALRRRRPPGTGTTVPLHHPPGAGQRTNAAGQVVLKLKAAWRDGTTHLVMSPLEFMQRLAALVPRPRLHLIRFHGVLAPNAKLRALVVPQVVPQESEPAAQQAKPAECEANCAHHRPVRLSWAKLLKRVFEIDMEHCPNCGGQLKIIAAILEQPVIEKILTHLGLQARAPPRAPARGQALQVA